MCLFPPPHGVELGGSKDRHVWNIIMYWNGKVDSHTYLRQIRGIFNPKYEKCLKKKILASNIWKQNVENLGKVRWNLKDVISGNKNTFSANLRLLMLRTEITNARLRNEHENQPLLHLLQLQRSMKTWWTAARTKKISTNRHNWVTKGTCFLESR